MRRSRPSVLWGCNLRCRRQGARLRYIPERGEKELNVATFMLANGIARPADHLSFDELVEVFRSSSRSNAHDDLARQVGGATMIAVTETIQAQRMGMSIPQYRAAEAARNAARAAADHVTIDRAVARPPQGRLARISTLIHAILS
jgi:hypothetical protein